MAGAAAFPTNWQEIVTEALKEARKAQPGRAVFGIMLPDDWKSELQSYAQNGELRRLFGVKAVAFSGKTISTFDFPKAKEASSPKKVG
jgi:hypothetical protein